MLLSDGAKYRSIFLFVSFVVKNAVVFEAPAWHKEFRRELPNDPLLHTDVYKVKAEFVGVHLFKKRLHARCLAKTCMGTETVNTTTNCSIDCSSARLRHSVFLCVCGHRCFLLSASQSRMLAAGESPVLARHPETEGSQHSFNGLFPAFGCKWSSLMM